MLTALVGLRLKFIIEYASTANSKLCVRIDYEGSRKADPTFVSVGFARNAVLSAKDLFTQLFNELEKFITENEFIYTVDKEQFISECFKQTTVTRHRIAASKFTTFGQTASDKDESGIYFEVPDSDIVFGMEFAENLAVSSFSDYTDETAALFLFDEGDAIIPIGDVNDRDFFKEHLSIIKDLATTTLETNISKVLWPTIQE